MSSGLVPQCVLIFVFTAETDIYKVQNQLNCMSTCMFPLFGEASHGAALQSAAISYPR